MSNHENSIGGIKAYISVTMRHIAFHILARTITWMLRNIQWFLNSLKNEFIYFCAVCIQCMAGEESNPYTLNFMNNQSRMIPLISTYYIFLCLSTMKLVQFVPSRPGLFYFRCGEASYNIKLYQRILHRRLNSSKQCYIYLLNWCSLLSCLFAPLLLVVRNCPA